MNGTQETVRRLLRELRAGDSDALDRLLPLVYRELKDLARRQRRRWQGDYTLNTTALLHEAYMKLVGQERVEVESRAHFRALAARAMRHILCDYARERRANKRGGDLRRLPIEALTAPPAAALTEERSLALLSLDKALERLEARDPRQARVVECRFFGGLTVEETAGALGVSPRTVKRDWAVAQAWLHRAMTSAESRGRSDPVSGEIPER